MTDHELIEFLQWCMPKLHLAWPGFRKVRRTIRKRLVRRMRELGVTSLHSYREKLKTSPAEWVVLDELSRIPISRFYRDRFVYDMLANSVLPDCAERASIRGDGMIGILSAGCASGEEPYSVSLVWHLRIADRFPDCAIDVLAVDVDDVMLERAQRACYAPSALKDLPEDLLVRGFRQENDAFHLQDQFRKCVRFSKCDLRTSLPDGPFDLILCRNTAFTYFDRATQAQTLARFNTALRAGGYLVVGAHETPPIEAGELVLVRPGQPLFRKPEQASETEEPAPQATLRSTLQQMDP